MKRDVSKCLILTQRLKVAYPQLMGHQDMEELEETLRNMDARTGKKDPTKRAHPGSASHVDGNEPSRRKPAKKAKPRR